MGHDHGGGIVRQCGFDYLADGDEAVPQTPAKQRFSINHLMPDIEINHQQDLMLQSGAVQLQLLADVCRGFHRALISQLGCQPP